MVFGELWEHPKVVSLYIYNRMILARRSRDKLSVLLMFQIVKKIQDVVQGRLPTSGGQRRR